MSDHIVGMMWNRNEGDIIAETIESALKHVDTLVIADDGSTDNSWDIIQHYRDTHKDQIEHIQRKPDWYDKGQKKALLEVIRSRYRPEDSWVQVIESDIMILETDLRRAIEERGDEVRVIWTLLNGVIPPDKSWEELDEYPNWSRPITEILTYAHRMEEMTYTFRPFPELQYGAHFTPWPKQFSKLRRYEVEKPITEYTPLLAHYGYRGPTHMRTKGVPYEFDSHFSKNSFPMSRRGWMNSKGRRGIGDDKVWCEGVEGWRRPGAEGYEPWPHSER